MPRGGKLSHRIDVRKINFQAHNERRTKTRWFTITFLLVLSYTSAHEKQVIALCDSFVGKLRYAAVHKVVRDKSCRGCRHALARMLGTLIVYVAGQTTLITAYL